MYNDVATHARVQEKEWRLTPLEAPSAQRVQIITDHHAPRRDPASEIRGSSEIITRSSRDHHELLTDQEMAFCTIFGLMSFDELG